jgi:hypothetical protein
MEEEGVEPRPTHFNTAENTSFLEVSVDKLAVRYSGRSAHDHDIGISLLLLLLLLPVFSAVAKGLVCAVAKGLVFAASLLFLKVDFWFFYGRVRVALDSMVAGTPSAQTTRFRCSSWCRTLRSPFATPVRRGAR